MKNLIAVALLFTSALTLAEAVPDNTGTVLITGANRGIGLELARQYSDAGWDVIGTARRPDAATELRELGVHVVQLDVTNQDSVSQMAKKLGDQAIDLLINNAGILPPGRSVSGIDFEVFNQVLAVNTVGPIRVTQALLPNLQAGEMKTIVNTTSELGSISENSHGSYYGYRESKAALNMFTRSLAAELRPDGFTCIVIHPGWVQTDMGGPSATVTVPDSAAGIRKVITNLSIADTGTFWNFEGQILPW